MYPKQEFIDSYHKKRSQVRKVALSFAAVVLAAGVGYGLVKEMHLVTFAAPVLAVMIHGYFAKFSEKDYYDVAGSRGPNGEHRCVFCGNKGIHRKGEYKTDNTSANCSKCGTFLFQE